MTPANLALRIDQGATFRALLRLMQPNPVYKLITGIAPTGPVRLTVEHGLPGDWPVWVEHVRQLPEANRAPLRQLPHMAQVVTATELDLPGINATGTRPEGGQLVYRPPLDLTDATAELRLYEEGAEVGTLSVTVNAGGWVDVELSAAETDALAWRSREYVLDVTLPNGDVLRAYTGTITVEVAGAAAGQVCHGAAVVGGDRGPAGPTISAATVDTDGHLILTLQDGTEIDAGVIDRPWGTILGDITQQLDLMTQLGLKVDQSTYNTFVSQTNTALGDRYTKSESDARYDAALRQDLANDTDPAKGAAIVGYSDARTYPSASVGLALKELRYAISIKPSNALLSTLGIVIGVQDYDAASIGARSVLISGASGDSSNRLPGGRELRCIVGGYDNEISSDGASGGLACGIFHSHHSSINNGANHCVIVGGSYNIIDDGTYNTISGGTANQIAGTYNPSGLQNNTIAGGARNTIDGSNSTIFGGADNTLRGNGTIVGGQQNSVGQTTGSDYSVVLGLGNTVDRSYNFAAGFQNTLVREYSSVTGRGNLNQSLYSRSAGRSALNPLSYCDAYGYGTDNTQGVAGRLRYPLVRTTTDATPGNLASIQHGSVGPAAVANTSVVVKATVRGTSGTDMAVFEIKFAFIRTTATTVCYNTSTTLGATAGATAWSAAFSGQHDCRISVTGEAGKTINWAADVEYMVMPL